MADGLKLYRWDRISKPRTYSRSQRMTSSEDVQNWIKKVEEASDNAAAAAFGSKLGSRGQGHRSGGQGHREAQMTIDGVHEHDAAYAEAQELLKEWVNEKLDFDQEDEEYVGESWHKTAADVKKEWDSLVDLEDYGIEDDGTMRVLKHKVAAADVYWSAEQEDEADVVDSILHNMMQKEVVSQAVIADLGLNDNNNVTTDPSTKMKLRHQQVKENREKRNRLRDEKMREQQRRKEAQHQAQQILLQEEREKVRRKKEEESRIQEEMMRIRKELQADRRKEEDERKRQKQEQEKEKEAAAELLSRQQRELQQMREVQQREKDKQRHLEAVALKLKHREMRSNYKLLHTCFSSWYDIIIQRRLQMGKACAMSDWRTLLRSWTAWRAYTRNRKVEREAVEHQENMKTYQKRVAMADLLYRRTLLWKCFSAWQLWLQQHQSSNRDEQTQNTTRSKMAAFLQAAAEGALWRQEPEGAVTERSNAKVSRVDRSRSAASGRQTSTDSARRIVDDMFSSKPDVQPLTMLSLTDRSESSEHTMHSDLPTQPWQITKKHLKLSNEQIAALGQQGAAPASASSFQTSPSKRPKPWQKTAPPVNNFENRYVAQQKMLKSQQQQLREQQRLIQDLQQAQQVQQMQYTIAQQQALQVSLSKAEKEVIRSGEQAKQSCQQVSQRTEHITQVQSARSTVSTTSSSHGAAASDMSATRGRQNEDSRHFKFVKVMEERAVERARQKREREERRQQQELQRLAQIQAEEEEERQKEEEEKRRKREEYLERKRQEKQMELEKQQWEQRLKELTRKANAHYCLTVTRQRGWKPWRRLIELKHEKEETAKTHYVHTILRKCLLSWQHYARSRMEEKEKMADEMRLFLLVQRSFNRWKQFGRYMVIQEERAMRHHRQTLLQRALRCWADVTTSEQIAGWEKERRAREHNVWRLKRNAFRTWRRYPQLIKVEVERERRRQEMRKKVATLLPDFQTGSLSEQ